MSQLTEYQYQRFMGEIRNESFRQSGNGNKEMSEHLRKAHDHLSEKLKPDMDIDKARFEIKRYEPHKDLPKQYAKDNITAAGQAIADRIGEALNMLFDKAIIQKIEKATNAKAYSPRSVSSKQVEQHNISRSR